MSAAPTDLPSFLAHDYEVDRLLGRGGMSTVWKATRRRDGKPVALKILSPDLVNDVDLVARLDREAQLSAMQIHPTLVAVLESDATTNPPYLVMELVEGASLHSLIRRERPFEVERALDLATALADCLAALHEHGVVHRDLKPENVIVQRDDSPRLLDLGLARAGGGGGTGTGILLGTPLFLAPEVCRGEAAGPASDVFALGLMLLDCLSPRSPFAELPEEAARLLAERARGTERLPFPPGLPGPVHRLVKGLVADDPRSRPADGRELLTLIDATRGRLSSPRGAELRRTSMVAIARADLNASSAHVTREIRGGQARPTRELRGPGESPGAEGERRPGFAGRGLAPPPLLRRWAIGATALALLLLALGGGVSWWRTRSASAPPPRPTATGTPRTQEDLERWSAEVEKLGSRSPEGSLPVDVLRPPEGVDPPLLREALARIMGRLAHGNQGVRDLPEADFDRLRLLVRRLVELQLELPGLGARPDGRTDAALLDFGNSARYLIDAIDGWEAYQAKRQVEGVEEMTDLRSLLKSYRARTLVQAIERPRFRAFFAALDRLWTRHGAELGKAGGRLLHPGLEVIMARILVRIALAKDLAVCRDRMERVAEDLSRHPLASQDLTLSALRMVLEEIAHTMRKTPSTRLADWEKIWTRTARLDEPPGARPFQMTEGRVLHASTLLHGWHHVLVHGSPAQRETAACALRDLPLRFATPAHVPWVHELVIPFLRQNQRGDLAEEVERRQGEVMERWRMHRARIKARELRQALGARSYDAATFARWRDALRTFLRRPTRRASSSFLRNPDDGVPPKEALQALHLELATLAPRPGDHLRWSEAEGARRYDLLIGVTDLLLRFPGLVAVATAEEGRRLLDASLVLVALMEELRLWERAHAMRRLHERSEASPESSLFHSLPVQKLALAREMERFSSLSADLGRLWKREGSLPSDPASPLLAPPLELILGTALVHSRAIGEGMQGRRRLLRVVEGLRTRPWLSAELGLRTQCACLARILDNMGNNPNASEKDYVQVVRWCEDLDGPPFPDETAPGIRRQVTATARTFHACHLLRYGERPDVLRGYDMALALLRLYDESLHADFVHRRLRQALAEAGFERKAAELEKELAPPRAPKEDGR